jgi:cytochrome c556
MRSRSKSPSIVRMLALAALPIALGCKGERREPAVVAAESAADTRTAVVLPADGQQAVLREMRQLLGAMGGAMTAAVKGDTAALLAALAPAGSAAAADPAIEALLPAAWKELAERTHGGFDTLAIAIRKTRGREALRDTVLVRLGQLSASCSACHETFRVTVR